MNFHENIVDLCSDKKGNLFFLQNLNRAYTDAPYSRVIKIKYKDFEF